MNNGTAATTTTGLGGGAYSFYLNVVVLNQALTPAASSVDDGAEATTGGDDAAKGEGGTTNANAASASASAPPREEANLAPAAAREDDDDDEEEATPEAGGDEEEGGATSPKGGGGTVVAKKGLLDSMTMPASMAGMSAGLKSLSFKETFSATKASSGAPERSASGGLMSMSMKGGALDKSLHNTMKAVSKRSAALSDKAGRYVAAKTMIARASTALDKALPEVAAGLVHSGAGGSAGSKLDMTIGRRFTQGPVMVLQVDLKASGLAAYVEAVRGEDAAEHYRCALSSLRLLGATRAAAELEREMLPLVRRGLMERTGEEVVRMMKAKDESGAPLEVECIALEEGEEARWLFTYMEFQSQMK